MDNIEDFIESIRAGLAPDATPESRAATAAVCRTILVALDPVAATLPEPTSPAPTTLPSDSQTIVPDVAAIADAIRGVPIDQLLDLAIAKLRTIVPADAETSPRRGLSIPLIPVPRR